MLILDQLRVIWPWANHTPVKFCILKHQNIISALPIRYGSYEDHNHQWACLILGMATFKKKTKKGGNFLVSFQSLKFLFPHQSPVFAEGLLCASGSSTTGNMTSNTREKHNLFHPRFIVSFPWKLLSAYVWISQFYKGPNQGTFYYWCLNLWPSCPENTSTISGSPSSPRLSRPLPIWPRFSCNNRCMHNWERVVLHLDVMTAAARI